MRELDSALPACAHRWTIDEPKGPTSRGVCRACGASRDFRNWGDDPDWSDHKPKRRGARVPR